MTALLINIKIDESEIFEIFKVTLQEIQSLFDECHIKIRGNLANECISFAKDLMSDRAIFYQELQETDWVAATLKMIENLKSKSIFFYIEDHKLITSYKDLRLVLKEFEECQLDFLCYSFFKASRLDVNNLLPLNPKHYREFSQFSLNNKNIKILQKISPLYNIFSLASIFSVHYFMDRLNEENKKFKIYIRKLSTLLSIIFPYPRYVILINFINYFLSFINSRLCFYPINSPFNMEKLNISINDFELKSITNKWKFAILKNELFANFDDDNHAYGESLIKRGLYPFHIEKEVDLKTQHCTKYTIKLRSGDFYDCTYYSQIHRIRYLPVLFIKVNFGKLSVNYCGKDKIIEKGDYQGFYTNVSPIINCIEDSEITISIYDECFR